jgi:hypothetical protein
MKSNADELFKRSKNIGEEGEDEKKNLVIHSIGEREFDWRCV